MPRADFTVEPDVKWGGYRIVGQVDTPGGLIRLQTCRMAGDGKHDAYRRMKLRRVAERIGEGELPDGVTAPTDPHGYYTVA